MIKKNTILFLCIIGYQHMAFGAFPAWFVNLISRGYSFAGKGLSKGASVFEGMTVSEALSITTNTAQIISMVPALKQYLEDPLQKKMNELSLVSTWLQVVGGLNSQVTNLNFKNLPLTDKYICYRLGLREKGLFSPFST